MDWKTLGIKELKRRAVFLIITISIMSANLAFAVELDPISIAQQGEKLGIVGIMLVVIVIQSAGLLYLMRLIGTKFYELLKKSIETNERVVDAVNYCKTTNK